MWLELWAPSIKIFACGASLRTVAMACAQAVHAALYGTVVFSVKIVHRVDDACGFLRGGGAVEEGEGLSVFIARDEHRKFIANIIRVKNMGQFSSSFSSFLPDQKNFSGTEYPQY